MLLKLVVIAACVSFLPFRVVAQPAGSGPPSADAPRSDIRLGPIVGAGSTWFGDALFLPIVGEAHPGDTALILGAADAGGIQGWTMVGGLEASVTLGEDWRLAGDLLFERRYGSSVVMDDQPRLINVGGGEREKGRRFVTRVWLESFETRVWAGYRLPLGLPFTTLLACGVAEAISTGSRVYRAVEADEPLANPYDVPSEINGHRLVYYDDSVPDQKPVELAALARVSIEVPLGRAWVGLDVAGRVPLTEIADSLRVTAVELSVHVAFALGE